MDLDDGVKRQLVRPKGKYGRIGGRKRGKKGEKIPSGQLFLGKSNNTEYHSNKSNNASHDFLFEHLFETVKFNDFLDPFFFFELHLSSKGF